MDFSSDVEVQRMAVQLEEFFREILHDEEAIFVSDEATIYDVSVSDAEELTRRCSEFYGKPVLESDLRLPLWKLVRKLNQQAGKPLD